MARETLSGRRACHTFELRFGNADFATGVGVFADGRPAEVFVTGAKAGSDVQALARDGAILLSLALQFGVPLETIKHAITRTDREDTPASLIGALVDGVEAEGPALREMAALLAVKATGSGA